MYTEFFVLVTQGCFIINIIESYEIYLPWNSKLIIPFIPNYVFIVSRYRLLCTWVLIKNGYIFFHLNMTLMSKRYIKFYLFKLSS